MVKPKGSDSLLSRLRDLPLRYRLSFAFFFLALFGTFSLVTLSIFSQRELIRQEESERLLGYHRALDHNIELQGRWAVSLASSFALNPEIAEALADRDRLRLIRLCYPAYLFMKREYGISQFHFQILPPRSFVRLHRLYEFGDDLSYRQTIRDALDRGQPTFGLEAGLTGYGIRGVAPILYRGEAVGTVEIGFSFGSVFLERLKEQFNIEASFLVPNLEQSGFTSIATTFPRGFERDDPLYTAAFRGRVPQMTMREIDGVPYAVLVRTVEDYNGMTVALVELCVKRTETLNVIRHYRHLMLGIGILGMILSVAAIYLISKLFTQPIGTMVTFAREIALGQKVRPLTVRPSGELKVLASALDDMLMSLEESRRKLRNHTDNLEEMVTLRTRALRESEEKYRTLVENVPLVVYRLLADGKTIYINHFIEDLTGIPSRQVLEDARFWKEKVWEDDQPRIWPLMERCLKEGREFKAEYRIRHKSGRLLFVLDHAIPVFDEEGQVETVDGFLVNVTDRHQLQQQIIQTEALRTLSEVSARLAHEIRNPLVAAGGFARRLLHSLPEADPNRERVHIIVQEVVRLEKILEKTLAYLKPFEIVTERSSLNDLLREVLEEHKEVFARRSMTLTLDLSERLVPVSLDRVLFKTVIETILHAMLDVSQPGKTLEVRTRPGENVVHVEMVLDGMQASDDDIEHFFYPFTSRGEGYLTLDLPLAKMIVHKHQGLIDLRRKDANLLVLDITLPG